MLSTQHEMFYNCPQSHVINTHVTLQLSTITCYQHTRYITTVHNHMLSTHTLHNEIALYTGILSQNIDRLNQNNR
jgi:hypothetical protein